MSSVITTLEDLAALEPEWRDLVAADPQATPFQGPDWLLSWWRYRGRGRLRVLVLRAGSRLIGLAPFCIRSTAGLRRLELAATGGTDYLEVLAHPEHRPGALPTISDYLEETRGEWDACDFQQLRAGSLLRELPPPAGCSSEEYAQEVAPALSLAPGDDLPHTVPKRMRGNVRYYQRRLDAEGVTTIEQASEDTVDEHLDTLFRLHQARWRGRWQPGAFAAEAVREQHREFARKMGKQDRLRLWSLRLNGEIIASLYCFRDEFRLYYYAAGFDPSLAHCSPGTLLLAHAIRSAQAEGLVELDFLRGNEAYKYAWGAEDRQNYRRVIWQHGARGTLARALAAAEMYGEHKAKALSTRLNRWRG